MANNTIISALVSLGFGTDQAYTTHMTILLAVSADTTPLARIWSKTSFALTLLRVLDVQDVFQRIFIWFVIASMHIVSILYIVMAWRRVCESADTENSEAVGRIRGSCVPLATILAIQISNVGKSSISYLGRLCCCGLVATVVDCRKHEEKISKPVSKTNTY